MSWEQLLAIAEQNANALRDAQTRPPHGCPNDGTVLETGPNGELFCRFDGWEYPRDWVVSR